MESNPICQLSSAKKNEMLLFGLCSTSDDQLGLSMDLNPIHHPSPAKKKEILIFVLRSTSDVGQTGQWTQTPSTTALQPIKWNASFWIMFNFWWSARLVNGLKPHLPPLSSQKNEMPIFWLCSSSDDWPGWSMDSKKNEMLVFGLCSLLMICLADWWTWTPSATLLLQKKWNAQFLIMFNFWWLARLINGHKPHPPRLSSQKHEMLIFVLHLISDDWPGWVMDSNPIHHLSPAKNMKCSFLDYIQLWMIGRAGRWTQTPSTTHLQPIKWNPHFCITLNFWWSAGLVNGLKTHLPPLSSQ